MSISEESSKGVEYLLCTSTNKGAKNVPLVHWICIGNRMDEGAIWEKIAR